MAQNVKRPALGGKGGSLESLGCGQPTCDDGGPSTRRNLARLRALADMMRSEGRIAQAWDIEWALTELEIQGRRCRGDVDQLSEMVR